MKKFLLSLGVVASALTSNATVYTVYNSVVEESGWTVNADDQFELQTQLRGADFTVITAKDPRSSTYKPGDGHAPIRLRQDSALSISSTSVEMKGIRFTYASMSDTYVAQGTVSEGWIQGDIIENQKNDLPFSLVITNTEGSHEFTFTSSEKYIMISKIEVTNTNFDDADEPDVVLNSISDIYEKDLNPGDLVSVNFKMTTAYSFSNNIYATDADGKFIKVVGPVGYEPNFIISANWLGTFSIDNGFFPVIYAQNCPDPSSSRKEDFTPAEVSAATAVEPMNMIDLVNNVFVINNIELEESTPYDNLILYDDMMFKGKSGDIELTFYNAYNVPSVAPGTYDITVIFANIDIDDEDNVTPIFYVTAFKKSQGSGIDNLTDSCLENTEPVYYTIQGMKVAAPEKGMYIRVENGKASKIIVK